MAQAPPIQPATENDNRLISGQMGLPKFFQLKLSIIGLLTAAGAVAAAASIAGFGGRYWWRFDQASHFRVQYFIALAIVAAALCVVRAYRTAVLFALVAVVNLALVIPLYTGAIRSPATSDRSLRAMLINVYRGNRDHAAVLDTIDRHNPDFVIAEEVNQRWMQVFRTLREHYPHVVSQPREDNFGIVLLSKHPIVESSVINVGRIGLPTILARFDVKGDEFFLLGTHAVPPVSSKYARLRNEHLAAIPEIVAALDAPVLLLGDLNVSPWSFHFRRLIRDSGLRDGSQGRGVQPTWPTHMLPLLIPIDHCLHSPGIDLVDKTVAAHVGSDHYPVVVDFAP
jgi:endonuclease/exonuclease/phosphatase (EEP) superfamily protein YafD